MSPKIYLRLLQGGLIVSLLAILFVFHDLLFPYITSKQLPFNIIIEVLLVFWLVFIWRYPQYRPKKSWLTGGLIAYFLVILISCFTGVDFNLSFWGDAERMLGFFHLLHFLIFYYILITVFRSWLEWKILLLASIAVAVIVSLFGLLGANPHSTIGNTAYVSGYLIFNLYFCVLLFFRSSAKIWRWWLLVPVIIMFLEFRNMHTSGAIIGLAISVLLLFLLLGLTHVNKQIRRLSLAIFILAIVGIIFIFSQYNSSWFQNSFLKNLTFQKATFQTRLISWRGAWQDFGNHPILGTGFGNYAVTFDKYFDPTFFNYVRNETYFDRAHNNLIDIASTTGVLGLITYLSIFIVVLIYLWKEFRRNGGRASASGSGLRNLELIVLVALLAAYFIQNLAVFDSFITYISLMITLGFVYWLAKGKITEEGIVGAEITPRKLALQNQTQELAALGILIILIYIVVLQFNIKPWRTFQGVINGYAQIISGQLANGLDEYKASLKGGPLDRDGQNTLINLIISNPEILSYLPITRAAQDLEYIVYLAEKNVSYNPLDSLSEMQLAQIYDTAARFYYRDNTKLNYYSAKSLEAIDRSIESSPRRVPVYLVKAQILLVRGEKDEAVDLVKYAISLNPDFPDGYCRLAQFYLLLEENDQVEGPLNKCLELDGAEQINSDMLLKQAITFYASQEDYDRALILAERLATLYGKDPEVWYNLAKLYLVAGNEEGARNAEQKALAINPQLKQTFQELFDLFEGAKK